MSGDCLPRYEDQSVLASLKANAKAAEKAHAEHLFYAGLLMVDKCHGDTVGSCRANPEKVEAAKFGWDAAFARFDRAVLESLGGETKLRNVGRRKHHGCRFGV